MSFSTLFEMTCESEAKPAFRGAHVLREVRWGEDGCDSVSVT